MTVEYPPRPGAPVACTATNDEAAAQSALICALRDEAIELTRTDDGVRLRFEPDAERRGRIVEWIERERECCGFLWFRLDDGDGVLTLEISGGDEAQAWIETVLER